MGIELLHLFLSYLMNLKNRLYLMNLMNLKYLKNLKNLMYL